MANEKPARYVVVVWFHDHWAVTLQTDDQAEAEKAYDAAKGYLGVDLRPIFLDTESTLTWKAEV